MRLLHEQPEGAEAPSLGRQILEDFWKGFQSYLDKLAWREARLCVSGQSPQRLLLLNSEQIQFFAHLTMARMISPDSMISLLQAFTSVLDEFGVSHGRAKRAAMCAAEGLMFVCGFGWYAIPLTDALQAGPILKAHSALSVTDIINAIQAYNETMNNPRWLVQSSAEAHQEKNSDENTDEVGSQCFDKLVNSLHLSSAA
jgi:nuclear cap-binding protein subunit 1